MYNAIVSAVQSRIISNRHFDLIVPSGTAVQNARTSLIGDTLTLDGHHMSLDFGRYLTAMTFIHTLTGLSLGDIGYRTDGVSELERLIAVEAVNHAATTPFTVTQSAYTGETPKDGYILLKPQTTKGGYWYPTQADCYNTIVTHAANSKSYFATLRFTKEDLPIGSIIMLNDGWQYRPDGWITDTVQTTRANITAEPYVVVTEEWWGDYTIRAFNISKIDLSSLEDVTLSEVHAAFRIYVPAESHKHNYAANVTEANCTATGLTTYTCTFCAHSYSEVIAALGHSYTA